MTDRPATRPSWRSLAVLAPGSLVFLAATVMWVGAHTTTAGSTATGSTGASSGATGPGDIVPLGLDTATSLRLARLQVLLGQAEARLVLLDRGAGAPVQVPSPGVAEAVPSAPVVQPPIAPSPAPVAHATTGASGA